MSEPKKSKSGNEVFRVGDLTGTKKMFSPESKDWDKARIKLKDFGVPLEATEDMRAKKGGWLLLNDTQLYTVSGTGPDAKAILYRELSAA